MTGEMLGIYLRGLAMGAADVVPGVSGGTIAFVTGIYERLIDALGAFTPTNARRLLRRDFRGFWRGVDGNFLLVLFAGILSSVVSLARLLSHLLVVAPHLVWAFFAGLVIASAIQLGAHTRPWRLAGGLSFGAGLVAAILVVCLPPVLVPDSPMWIFLSGAIAVCAMVLPGISGSFILLLLGMYAPTLAALTSLDIAYLVIFASGCVLGLLAFSQLLRWFLHRYHDNALMLLTGFLTGSLPLLWPWQIRQTGGAMQILMPVEYEMASGRSPQVLTCLLFLALGTAVVASLSRIRRN